MAFVCRLQVGASAWKFQGPVFNSQEAQKGAKLACALILEDSTAFLVACIPPSELFSRSLKPKSHDLIVEYPISRGEVAIHPVSLGGKQ